MCEPAYRKPSHGATAELAPRAAISFGETLESGLDDRRQSLVVVHRQVAAGRLGIRDERGKGHNRQVKTKSATAIARMPRNWSVDHPGAGNELIDAAASR